MIQCKGITVFEKRCKRMATVFGFCAIHVEQSHSSFIFENGKARKMRKELERKRRRGKL